eukprot:s6851_g1.t1
MTAFQAVLPDRPRSYSFQQKVVSQNFLRQCPSLVVLAVRKAFVQDFFDLHPCCRLRHLWLPMSLDKAKQRKPRALANTAGPSYVAQYKAWPFWGSLSLWQLACCWLKG